jgi:uncharacterized protein (DUF58 family)
MKALQTSEESRRRTMELIREIRRIEIQTSRLVEQHLAGSYHSVFKGQGIAFDEVRAYEHGDDVRRIDWNVTARTGAPHVKLFAEERELTVMLVVDMSGSLDLGSRDYDKRQLVARLVATFAFSAISNNDRVGLIGFTDRVEVFVPPRKGRKHVLAVVQRVLTHQPQRRGTKASAGLEYLVRIAKGHAVAVLVSDFVDATNDTRFEHALELVRRRHDVIPIRVEDPIELALPPLGILAVEDLELLDHDGVASDWVVDLGRGAAKRYEAEVARERMQFEKLMRKLALATVNVRCGADWQQPLVAYFARRNRRMRH